MGELALRGVGAAPGITHGAAFVLGRARGRHANVAEHERSAQAAIAHEALEHVAADLESIATTLRTDGREQEADIVETGALMAKDPSLAAAITELVMSSGRGCTTA